MTSNEESPGIRKTNSTNHESLNNPNPLTDTESNTSTKGETKKQDEL